MTDYKDTLNLPKTSFPMKANLAQREPEMLKRWQSLNIYEMQRKRVMSDAKTPRFVLHDGPPYANGRPHLGTALNKILKDMVMKSKRLSGFDAPYVPGWDCHGLPIELNVEKKKGKPGVKLSVKEFRAACREYAAKQVAIQKEDFQRLGVLGDWDHPYLTMDFSYEANAVRALGQIIQQGHLHRGQKPVHWCPACGSALAEAEVEYQDKTSTSIDVAFMALEPQKVIDCFDLQDGSLAVDELFVPIWTTTPWTLPANQAVAVNPNLTYVLVQADRFFVLAKTLMESALARYGISDYRVVAEVQGSQLDGLMLQHPFLDRVVPIVLGDHVTTDAGTGNVHTAPAHGLEDYGVGRRYGLSVDNPVGSDSCFVEGTPLVEGLHVYKANEPILDALKSRGVLLHSTSLEHSYPHCWRHKTPLIFRATPQWFISMEQNGLRQSALSAIESVDWIPEWGEARIRSMVEERPDWCISRQRTWGIPLPLFVHKQTAELHPDTVELVEQVAKLIEQSGVDAWYDLDPETLLGDEAKHYDRVTDILDVWFDSGVTHHCVLAQRDHLRRPADLYLEGSDQHRGWFQSSLITGLAMCGESPFKSVLTHGYVVDGQGRKMSKSIGNVIFPADVVKNLGADILRLWAAATDHTVEINVSDEILSRSSDAYRRIRNTARFLLSNLNDFDPEKDQVPPQQMVALDCWAIATVEALQAKIIKAYNEYRFQSIFQMIHNFCAVEMGSFYLDIIKDRQYTAKQNSAARRSAQTALYHIVEALVRWLAPILSFTAEEIWQHMPGSREESVFLSTWYGNFPAVPAAQVEWPWLMQVRHAVNKVLESHRAQGQIGSALEAEVVLYADKEGYARLKALQGELRFLLITSGAEVFPENEAGDDVEPTEIPGLALSVRVSEHKKCVRCWQRRDDIGLDHAHPELCGRCVVNVSGAGEVRNFA